MRTIADPTQGAFVRTESDAGHFHNGCAHRSSSISLGVRAHSRRSFSWWVRSLTQVVFTVSERADADPTRWVCLRNKAGRFQGGTTFVLTHAVFTVSVRIDVALFRIGSVHRRRSNSRRLRVLIQVFLTVALRTETCRFHIGSAH